MRLVEWRLIPPCVAQRRRGTELSSEEEVRYSLKLSQTSCSSVTPLTVWEGNLPCCRLHRRGSLSFTCFVPQQWFKEAEVFFACEGRRVNLALFRSSKSHTHLQYSRQQWPTFSLSSTPRLLHPPSKASPYSHAGILFSTFPPSLSLFGQWRRCLSRNSARH